MTVGKLCKCRGCQLVYVIKGSEEFEVPEEALVAETLAYGPCNDVLCFDCLNDDIRDRVRGTNPLRSLLCSKD